MIQIDLITGFLGSGKTTFIKKYADYLLRQGLKIGILENDYGAVNVDMMLMQELEGENCGLEMVAGGCDADCHRRRFKTKLIAMGMSGYQRVLVEPSGIFDVDEFFDALHEEPLNRWYEIGNVIAIVDAGLEEELSEQSDYILASQIAGAGIVMLSHVQEVQEADLSRTVAHMNRALEMVKCKRRYSLVSEGDKPADILACDWDGLQDEDFDRLVHTGYKLADYRKTYPEDSNYTSLFFMNVRLSQEELIRRVEVLMKDTACGRIFRIKGFMQLEDASWIELNATHKKIEISPIAKGQEIIIVIGEQLQKEAIEQYWRGKEGFSEKV